MSGFAVDLSPRARVHAVFLCTRKAIERTTDRRALLSVTLRSRDLVVQGRTALRAAQLACGFEPDDVVEVMGKVVSFRGQAQIQLSSIVRSSWPAPDELLPDAKRDVDELDGFLEHLAREEVADPAYRALLDSLLADRKLRAAWRVAPCTLSDHHAYRGGALEHTVAVTMLAVALCDLHPALDKDVLVTAALVHELGTVAASAARRATPVKVPDRSLAHVLGASSARCELTAERRAALDACLGLGPRSAFERFRLERTALERIDALDAEVSALKAGAARCERTGRAEAVRRVA